MIYFIASTYDKVMTFFLNKPLHSFLLSNITVQKTARTERHGQLKFLPPSYCGCRFCFVFTFLHSIWSQVSGASCRGNCSGDVGSTSCDVDCVAPPLATALYILVQFPRPERSKRWCNRLPQGESAFRHVLQDSNKDRSICCSELKFRLTRILLKYRVFWEGSQEEALGYPPSQLFFQSCVPDWKKSHRTRCDKKVTQISIPRF